MKDLSRSRDRRSHADARTPKRARPDQRPDPLEIEAQLEQRCGMEQPL